MLVMIGVAVGLVVFGLLICWLSPSGGKAATMFWWIGIVLAVIGVILLIAPVVVYVAEHLRAALGVNRGVP